MRSGLIYRRTFLIAAGVFMADMITANFSVHEMACKCGCGKHEMDEEFMRMLQTLRDEMQGPLRVTSGFHCEDHNQMVSTTGKNGPNTLAKASDILVSGERAMPLYSRKPVRSASVGSD